METVTIEKVWAIPCEQAALFFQRQPDVVSLTDGFGFKGCRIFLVPLSERSLGSLHLPQMKIIIAGRKEDADVICKRFYYNFLSAGG